MSETKNDGWGRAPHGLEALAIACAATVQTGISVEAEIARNAGETVVDVCKRYRRALIRGALGRLTEKQGYAVLISEPGDAWEFATTASPLVRSAHAIGRELHGAGVAFALAVTGGAGVQWREIVAIDSDAAPRIICDGEPVPAQGEFERIEPSRMARQFARDLKAAVSALAKGEIMHAGGARNGLKPAETLALAEHDTIGRLVDIARQEDGGAFKVASAFYGAGH